VSAVILVEHQFFYKGWPITRGRLIYFFIKHRFSKIKALYENIVSHVSSMNISKGGLHFKFISV